MGKKGKVDIKISREALIAMFFIGCLSLSLIGGIELTRLAGAWQVSNEGWIVFVRQDSGIWIMDADGKNEKQITDIEAGNPVCSPDGQRIAFRGFFGIYVMNADGSNMKQITNGGYDDFPTWSPDGTKIAFSSYPSSRWDERDIYVMDADGSNVQQLTKTKENEYAPDWTAYSYAVKLIGKLGTTWGKMKTK